MLIEVNNISRIYNLTRGLKPISFEVEKGELVAIVGHNGAGKSTLLKILSNSILPDAGEALIDGINLSNRIEMVRKIAFVSENPNLFDSFSVYYNFLLFARLFKIPFSRIEETLKEFNLESFRNTKVLDLSKGLKQRVSIGRALLFNPPILLLDEPTSGLDFEMTREIYRLLKLFHTRNKTIIFSTHRPEEIKNLATRILVLHQGELVFNDSPKEYFQSNLHEELYQV